MTYDAKVVQVMIASPGDVVAEREAIREIIAEWNVCHARRSGLVLLPVGWETHSSPMMGARPQATINEQVLKDCDILIAAFWTRLGSPTGVAASGTVEEINEHLAAGKRAMLYFSTAPVRLESVDDNQYKLLLAFKSDCLAKGLIEEYDSIVNFREKVRRHLSLMIDEEFPQSSVAVQWIGSDGVTAGENADSKTIAALTESAQKLLLAATDQDGVIMRVITMGGYSLQAGQQVLCEHLSGRDEAKWEAAVDQLERHHLIYARTEKRQVFSVTDEGYRLADAIRSVAAALGKTPPQKAE